ncbi:hypothetical protein [Corynebacterium ulceribovis]|uniref:hypothetical protein n=1 Tax=Corynebacterium ulceribovis TaxID=487732 RepID=UPI0003672E82|nr:hypothetical protein [Corynebacterium ulceribovis]
MKQSPLFLFFSFALVIVLVLLLMRTPLLLVGFLAASIGVVLVGRFLQPSNSALVDSLRLSLEDLTDILDQWTAFLHSNDPEQLADRTFRRPELRNMDTTVGVIAEFHDSAAASRRWARTVHTRLDSSYRLSESELERLLNSTDRHTSELRDLWRRARVAALAYGQGPSSDELS